MPKVRLPARLKREVIQRASACCEYCRSQARYATQSFAVEHTIPRASGGKTNLDNLGLACPGCNGHKHTKTTGRDPITGQIVPLFHPRQQNWQDHFAWTDGFTLIVGITPIGRATVETLHLNRRSLVNLRGVLYRMGEHPPEGS